MRDLLEFFELFDNPKGCLVQQLVMLLVHSVSGYKKLVPLHLWGKETMLKKWKNLKFAKRLYYRFFTGLLAHLYKILQPPFCLIPEHWKPGKSWKMKYDIMHYGCENFIALSRSDHGLTSMAASVVILNSVVLLKLKVKVLQQSEKRK